MSSLSTSALDSTYNDALGSAVNSATGGQEMDKQAFLMLLVTQFKYQDPLNPMEDKEFVAQLAQFSALEQQQETNANLGNLLGMQEQQATVSAASYIGKEVSANGYGVSLKDSKASTVQFAAAEPMSKCSVSILDSSNKTILTTVDLGQRAASIHDFVWDGKRADGSKAPDGVYTVSFVGYNEAGERVMIDTSVTGLVNGVSNYNGDIYLRMDDGRTVTLENVREVLLPTDKAAETTEEGKKEDGKEPAKEPADGSGTGNGDGNGAGAGTGTGTGSDPSTMDYLDQVADGAKSALSAWDLAREKIAALLGSGS